MTDDRPYQKEPGGDWYIRNGDGSEHRLLDLAPNLEREALKDAAHVAARLDFGDPLTASIMGAVRLHTHDHTMAYAITRDVLAVVRGQQQEPVAWRWQCYGIWHYAGGFPVSGAEALYLKGY